MTLINQLYFNKLIVDGKLLLLQTVNYF